MRGGGESRLFNANSFFLFFFLFSLSPCGERSRLVVVHSGLLLSWLRPLPLCFAFILVSPFGSVRGGVRRVGSPESFLLSTFRFGLVGLAPKARSS